MSAVMDVQASLSKLSLSSKDSRDPPASWEEVLDASVAPLADSVDSEAVRSGSASPPRHRPQHVISSSSTPLTPVATNKSEDRPPRRNASQAAGEKTGTYFRRYRSTENSKHRNAV